jgi:hypothetical protein
MVKMFKKLTWLDIKAFITNCFYAATFRKYRIVTFDIDPEVLKFLKEESAKRGTTIDALVEEILKKAILKHQAEDRK